MGPSSGNKKPEVAGQRLKNYFTLCKCTYVGSIESFALLSYQGYCRFCMNSDISAGVDLQPGRKQREYGNSRKPVEIQAAC
ncbi:hypothetical protein Q7C36_005976 [Tachysurus vachellii]|uniref:Uncharacterized protein n=1 Tax=Tachysurus vachellii TaxID=175792 RepID=A0AA88T2A9_TACVA|nr:hypothetical protein Q7C36_005976 [Tachysurus vachellii]